MRRFTIRNMSDGTVRLSIRLHARDPWEITYPNKEEALLEVNKLTGIYGQGWRDAQYYIQRAINSEPNYLPTDVPTVCVDPDD